MRNIIKVHGKTFENKQFEIIENIKNQAKEMKLKNLPDYKYDITDIEDTKSKLKNIIRYYNAKLKELKDSKEKTTVFEKMYSEVLNNDNIDKIIEMYVDEYIINSKDTQKNSYDFYSHYYICLNETLYFSANEIVKEIIRMYMKKIVDKMDFEKISSIELMLVEDKLPKNFFEALSIPFTNRSIENGIKEMSEITFYNEIHTAYESYCKHQCSNCPVQICDCPKILDRHKKYIAGYEFIHDGEQFADDKNILRKFLVYDCDKYNKAMQKKLTQ